MKLELRITLLFCILFLSLFLLAGCVTFLLNSRWSERNITIDGMSRDWLGALTYIEESDITVGVLNDENYIYVCFISEEPGLGMQLMRSSITLWFDPKGGKKKTFGIQYPLGIDENEMIDRFKRQRMDRENLRGPGQELEIIGPGKNMRERMPLSKAQGISVQLDFSSRGLTYEIKVPLFKSEQFPYAVGAKPGSTVGIGIVSPRFNPTMMRRSMGGLPGIGRGPGMGGIGGMRGGILMRPTMSRNLKVWMKTKLSTEEVRPGTTLPGNILK